MVDHRHERIRSAAAALEGARAAYAHSPNSETKRILDGVQATLDYRLEQLWASIPFDQRARIEARPVNTLVPA